MGIYLFVIIISALMLLWLSRGPFFVPARRKDVPRIIGALHLKGGEKIVDLGSGDGRLLIALAEAGAEAHGFEHNPLLVWRSRRNIRKAGHEGKAFVHYSNFWNKDFSRFDGAVIYGISYIMRRLEEKLLKEARPGMRIVSYSFFFPNWVPEHKEKGVYVYKK